MPRGNGGRPSAPLPTACWRGSPTPGRPASDFLEPFPLLVMCELVGIPYEDRAQFLSPADAALGALITLPEGRAATRQLRAYAESLPASRRRAPGDNILTSLAHACDRGVVDEESVLAFVLSMLVAGYRTSTMFLANAVLALLTEPDRYARLLRDRSLLPAAAEELLRFLPVQNGVVVLQARQDVTLHGRTVRAGEAVLPVLAAANRDERVFPEADRLVCPGSCSGRGQGFPRKPEAGFRRFSSMWGAGQQRSASPRGSTPQSSSCWAGTWIVLQPYPER
ncbi:cytochrome P450 [Streptomyces sp. NPDC045369]|uniref:cytochrome P450 n=1 Tax=Streptomyces sp. NPDC045369 TaxID=3155732 RepID=UPI003404AA32